MSIIKSTHSAKLSLNVQYDYITLRTPNGNFTIGRNGEKATKMDGASFDALCKYVRTSKKKNLQDTMETLLNPKTLSKYFPNWDEEPKSYKIGQKVKFTDPYVVKKFGSSATIVEVLRTNVVVQFTNKQRLKLDPSLIG
jgi:hypothetical protein